MKKKSAPTLIVSFSASPQYRVTQPVLLAARSSYSRCTVVRSKVNFEWTQSAGPPVPATLLERKAQILIPAHMLEEGNIYAFKLTAWMEGRSSSLTSFESEFVVVGTQLYAIVDGGSWRMVRANRPLHALKFSVCCVCMCASRYTHVAVCELLDEAQAFHAQEKALDIELFSLSVRIYVHRRN